MPRFVALNATIQSDIELPLPRLCTSGTAEIRIRLRSAPAPAYDIGRVEGPAHDVHVGWHAGFFHIRDGREIVAWPKADTPRARHALAHELCSGALGWLAWQRGCLVLHASAVAFDKGAIVLVGESGRGKSTLAAALTAAGGRLLCDDLCAIDKLDVLPTAAAANITVDVAQVLGLTANITNNKKQRVAVQHSTTPSPVAAIWLVGPRAKEPTSAGIRASDLLDPLMSSPFLARRHARGHFDDAMTLAEKVRAFEIVGGERLDDLPRTAELVISQTF